MAERAIAATDLMRTLPEVLAEVAQRGTVFLASMGQALEAGDVISGLVSATGEIVFALGPPHVLGGVFALIDEGYGWPYPVQASEVKAVSDLMPGHHRHPLIYHKSDCLAMSISLREYELLKQSVGIGEEFINNCSSFLRVREKRCRKCRISRSRWQDGKPAG